MKHKYFTLNKINPRITFFVIVFLFIFVSIPNTTSAAIIKASSDNTISALDTSIINIYLDTEGEVINSIDGSISLLDKHNDNFEVKDISLVNSAFSMWPRKPSLEEGHKINFVGGIPAGLKGDRLLLFKIVVKINEAGDFTIKPNNLTAYLNDGLGTSISIIKDMSTISIGDSSKTPTDKWQEIISNDNTAPEPFTINLIQDPNLFDGKKFISFETNDKESGIGYYEVKEGTYPSVRTGNTYVLIDQSKKVDVVVTAFDKAGNFQIATLKAKEPIHWIPIIIIVLFIILIYKIIKKIRKRKNV